MRKILFLSILSVLLVSCSKIHPYKVEIEQGNIIDQNTITQLHLGMNKNEVSSLIGNPVLGNIFSENTWAYVYTKQDNVGHVEKKKLILEFKDSKLIRIN